ncbi:enolase N-terminal domain-like protein [Macrolepiota fuliginosa MF-IS2]|uniref:Enolase N-terminal domain-like protein n=1 Tax=Macrolepiota fuliginosa MF-IS2 TaxID=1400762 RepID=A0A9P6BX13_9AGAR|nr:enolase N-terminal domain-like protein [Macrolepiota fuliginosa MF-IS2]
MQSAEFVVPTPRQAFILTYRCPSIHCNKRRGWLTPLCHVRNTDCDYSFVYVALFTSDPALTGYGMMFTIGHRNDIVCTAIGQLTSRFLAKDLEELFVDMGETWEYLNTGPQMRWIGPKKGVVHIGLGVVDNASRDLFARSRGKPLWKLVVDFTPEEFVRAAAWRHISDATTKEEAGKKEREAKTPRVCHIGGMAR